MKIRTIQPRRKMRINSAMMSSPPNLYSKKKKEKPVQAIIWQILTYLAFIYRILRCLKLLSNQKIPNLFLKEKIFQKIKFPLKLKIHNIFSRQWNKNLSNNKLFDWYYYAFIIFFYFILYILFIKTYTWATNVSYLNNYIYIPVYCKYISIIAYI